MPRASKIQMRMKMQKIHASDSYPFRNYPKTNLDEDGRISSIEFSPRVDIRCIRGYKYISFFVDGKEWGQCFYLKSVKTPALVEIESADPTNLDSILHYYRKKGEPEMADIPNDQKMVLHASCIIGWIENDYNFDVIDPRIAFGLIDFFVNSLDALQRKIKWTADCIKCGHPSVILSMLENYPTHVSSAIEIFIKEKDREEMIGNLIPWFGLKGLKEGFWDVFFDLLEKIDFTPPQWVRILAAVVDSGKKNDLVSCIKHIPREIPDDKWAEMLGSIFESSIVDAYIINWFLENVPKVLPKFVISLPKEKRNQYAKKLLSSSIAVRDEKRCNKEFQSTDILMADPEIIDSHYIDEFGKEFKVDIAVNYMKFIRKFPNSVSGKSIEKFLDYISNNVDSIRYEEYFRKNRADFFNINDKTLHPLTFDPPFIDVGVEVEQCITEDEFAPYKGIIKTSNGQKYPLSLQKDHKVFFGGDYDTIGLWEFDLGHGTNYEKLLDKFTMKDLKRKIPGPPNQWVWHTEFLSATGAVSGCSSHVHFSPTVFTAEAWKFLWDGLVLLLPLTAPFWIFGHRPRKTAFKENRWANPVYDRFNYEEIGRIDNDFTVKGKSGHYYQAAHQYDVLAWNKNEKPNLTIEFRLCEMIPTISLRACDAINSAFMMQLNGSGKPFEIENQEDTLKKIWALLEENDVYVALRESPSLSFSEKLPMLESYYPNALDFFVDFCKKYQTTVISKTACKVLDMFSKLLDIEKVDADNVWYIEEFYDKFEESTCTDGHYYYTYRF